jgi:hypothetical protein
MLNYTVELKDWNNPDNYPTIYTGSSLILALAAFKNAHLNNQDTILYIEDNEGNTLDTIENYGQLDNIINCNDLFVPENKELIKQNKELTTQNKLYKDMYTDQLNENTQLKKQLNRPYIKAV